MRTANQYNFSLDYESWVAKDWMWSKAHASTTCTLHSVLVWELGTLFWRFRWSNSEWINCLMPSLSELFGLLIHQCTSWCSGENITTPQPRTGDEVQQRSSRTPISQPENRDVARVSRSGSTTHGNAAQATSSHPQQRVTPTSSLTVPRATSTPPIPSSAQSCANSTTTSPLLLVS